MKKSKKDLKKAAAHSAAAASDVGQSAQYALNEAVARASELLSDAQKAAKPMAHDAKKKSAAKRLDAWEPHIKDAMDKVSPAVDAARDKISDDFLPRLQELLHDVADNPVVAETGSRGKAAVQALKGDLEPKRKKSKGRKFVKFIAISAIVAGAVAAVRHFLTPKDDGWTAHEPSKAYVNNNDTFATAAKVAGENTEAAASKVEDELVTDAAPAPTDNFDGGADAPVAQDAVANGDAGEETEDTDSGYGEGSYVGETPPEGFSIKGNERSKKYHLSGSGGYDRTIAEVWFNSEEAAEKAGFTRAQR